MAWLKIESSVARNRKFVQAGPAPSWLWVCGIAYSQEGLTDGFIAKESLPYLGVKNSAQLATHLVKAGLWDEVPGGWQIHDYLEHNRSAAQVGEIKAKKKENGKLGGRPQKNQRDNHMVSGSETHQVADAGAAVVAVGDLSERGPGETNPPMDLWFRQLQAHYPPHRVTRNARTEHAFVTALSTASDGPVKAWARMQANLSANVSSYEWQVKGMAPHLEKYLSAGLWENVLPAAPPTAEQVSSRTARTLQAAAGILREPA